MPTSPRTGGIFINNSILINHLFRLASYEQDLKAIADLRDIYVEAMEDFIDLWVECSEMSAWREEILSTEKRVRDHALAIRGQAVLLTRQLGLVSQQSGKGKDKRDGNLNDLLSRCDLNLFL